MSRLERIKKKDNLVHSRTEQERVPVSFGWLKIVVIFFLIGGLVYFIFLSGIFNIKTVDIIGYDSHKEAVNAIIRENMEGNHFSKNIFIFNARKLKETLYGDPSIRLVKVGKHYPSKIEIEIEVSRPSLIWASAGDKQLVDDGGVVLGSAGEIKLPEVSDASNIKVERGDRVASPTFIKFIKTISQDFEGATGSKISNINIFDLLTDVHILTTDGWTVYLDASKDPEAELKNLTRVLTEARKSGKKFQYIDLRLSNKAFYK